MQERLRVGIDGTPLLGTRTGVGHTVAATIAALARREDVDLMAYGITLRGRAHARRRAPLRRTQRDAPPSRPDRALALAAGGAAHDRGVDRSRRRGARHELRGTSGARARRRERLRPDVPGAAGAGRPSHPRQHAADPRCARAGRGRPHDERLRRGARRRGIRGRCRSGGAHLPGTADGRPRRPRGRASPRGIRAVRVVRRDHRSPQEPADARARVRLRRGEGSRTAARPRRATRRRLRRRSPRPSGRRGSATGS